METRRPINAAHFRLTQINAIAPKFAMVFGNMGRYGAFAQGCLRNCRDIGARKFRMAEPLYFLYLSRLFLPCLALSRPRGLMLTIDHAKSCLFWPCLFVASPENTTSSTPIETNRREGIGATNSARGRITPPRFPQIDGRWGLRPKKAKTRTIIRGRLKIDFLEHWGRGVGGVRDAKFPRQASPT